MKSFFIAIILILTGMPAMAGVSLFADSPVIDLGTHYDDEELRYELVLDNPSDKPVERLLVETSCGCTGVEILTDRIEPGGSITAFISIDMLGKRRKIEKTLDISFVHAGQPHLQQIDLSFIAKKRVAAHQGRSLQDSLFSGTCASCHAEPARGKQGEALFVAVCSQCHGMKAEGASAMGFTRLSYLKNLDTEQFFLVTRNGVKGQEYMPGFGLQHGGPLTDAQINSIVDYIHKKRRDTLELLKKRKDK